MTVPEKGERVTVTAVEPMHGVRGYTEVWVTAMMGGVTYNFRRQQSPAELLAFFRGPGYNSQARKFALLEVDPEAPVTLEGEVRSVYTRGPSARSDEADTVNCKLTGIIVGPHVWP